MCIFKAHNILTVKSSANHNLHGRGYESSHRVLHNEPLQNDLQQDFHFAAEAMLHMDFVVALLCLIVCIDENQRTDLIIYLNPI